MSPVVGLDNTDTVVGLDATKVVVGDDRIQTVVGLDASELAVGEDKDSTVIGEAPDTTVTVSIVEPMPEPKPTPMRPPAPPTTVTPPPAPPAKPIAEITLPGMNFGSNEYAITFDGMKRVAYVAQVMKANPNLRIRITGHTDNVGSDAANLVLSQNRAKSFLNALVGRYGINVARITWRGMGEREPTHGNETEAGRHANRRIVITPIF